MSDKEAVKAVKDLVSWARKRWGVEMETQYICPACGAHSDYESYCSNDGRKLKRSKVESDRQAYQTSLEDFIWNPEYPDPPTNDTESMGGGAE